MRLRKKSDDLLEDELLQMSKVFDALAHPARIRIFRFIMKCNKDRQPVCNKDVVAAFDYSQATISQHLSKLASSELIHVKKNEKFSMYYANFGTLMKYLDAFKKFE